MIQNTTRIQNTTLFTAIITSFLTTFTGSALNLSVPGIEAEFASNAVTVGWIITIYTMSAAVFSVPFGKMADVIGRRKVLLTGITVFAAASVACGMAPSIQMLIIFRFIQGVGSACLFATNISILVSVFPGYRRGEVLGISTAATYIGLSVGPVAGGFLNGTFGWRSIFAVSVMIAVAALAMALSGVPKDSKNEEKQKTDVIGNLLYVIMVGVFLFGFSNIAEGYIGKLMTVSGVVLLIIFGIYEGRVSNPVIKPSMFTQDAVFTLSSIAALLNYAATFAVTYLVSLYLQVAMDFSSRQAGLILIAMPFVQALITPKVGKLSDRVKPYKLASGGMTCCAAGLALFASIGVSGVLPFTVFSLLIMGLGFGLFSSPNTNAIMSRADKADYGVANSIVSTMRTVGQSFSMALVNIIVTLNLGEKSLAETGPDELVKTLRICFCVFLALCVIGTFISLKRGEKKENDI
ncbi:MAG: MFS transporter [Emergencia sp.]